MFVLRDNRGIHRIRKGQRRFRSIRIVKRRVCGKEGAIESGFNNRRASYRSVRTEKERGKLELQNF